jgi:nicotinamide riboside kinase
MEENLRQIATSIIKIALFGPESTGKTTIAKQLAEYYKTVWVCEFARDYLQEKWDKTEQICTSEDLLPIAVGQIKLENQAIPKANKYLFCDTNVLETKVFSDLHYGFCDPIVAELARNHEYDLFFLTNVDVPWQKDDLRDKPDDREITFLAFENALIQNKKPFITLLGNESERLEKAILVLENLEKAKIMGFSSYDFVQIYNHEIPLENIQKQLQIFKTGIAKTILLRPATLHDGILKLSGAEFQEKVVFFETNKSKLKLQKFVPASGAASRMFQFLSEFLNDFDIEKESINAYINRKKDSELSIFIVGMDKFPFFEAVYSKLKEVYPNFDALDRDYKNYYFIKLLLDPAYFDFANKPKAILPFHKYTTNVATPIQEHLYECASYSSSKNNSELHFTITKEHQDLFENSMNLAKTKVEKEVKTVVNVSYSYQNKATDSIAVDTVNNPFRDENDALVFRQAGHGALIENLNNQDVDVVFIKNIDNVVHNKLLTNSFYKKALAGILMQLQNQVFNYLNLIDSGLIDEEKTTEIGFFLQEKLNIDPVIDFKRLTLENKISILKTQLNKPIRVCGMVKNEGEPGGGPFWVKDEKGTISLQIVESAQVDLQSENQVKILANATHFNPVDLVCGIKNYKNQKFNLSEFVDEKAGFIVQKNKNGKELKGYELPGLWNGAMANWLTVFVELPIMTFNPVKTVNDLLKTPHQPQ